MHSYPFHFIHYESSLLEINYNHKKCLFVIDISEYSTSLKTALENNNLNSSKKDSSLRIYTLIRTLESRIMNENKNLPAFPFAREEIGSFKKE